MPVADTSKTAYQVKRDALVKRRAQVLSIIRDWAGSGTGPTTAEIAERLHVPDNQISGRVTELLADELILISGRKFNPRSGVRARTYSVPRSNEQLGLGI
jgi:DNA-binding Lrp family transcriptional regulator